MSEKDVSMQCMTWRSHLGRGSSKNALLLVSRGAGLGWWSKEVGVAGGSEIGSKAFSCCVSRVSLVLSVPCCTLESNFS